MRALKDQLNYEQRIQQREILQAELKISQSEYLSFCQRIRGMIQEIRTRQQDIDVRKAKILDLQARSPTSNSNSNSRGN